MDFTCRERAVGGITDMAWFKKRDMATYMVLAISLCFYLFFAFYDGAVICVDSPTYMSMSISREPLYPLLLAFLRMLFSDRYLFVTAFLQSILAAFAAVSIPVYLRKKCAIPVFLMILMTGMPLGCSFLCRFAAGRSSMYSNCIMTEGIACSLFLFFIRYLLQYCIDRAGKAFWIAATLVFLLISTRKQMYFTLILLLAGIFYVHFREHCLKRGIFTALLCAAGILVANQTFDNVYGYAVHGVWHTHSSDNRFLATVVFYTAERENGEKIEGEEARELFYQIYDVCDGENYLKHSAGKGWKQRVTHFGDHYDKIQIDTMWPAIEYYVADHYELTDVGREEKVDAITHEIIEGILPSVWVKVIQTFFDNLWSGFITTVAKVHPVLNIYVILVYVLYIVLLVGLWIKKKGDSVCFLLGMLTMASVLCNVGLVSAVIFCQTRYTIYNMPVFYMSLFFMLWECLKVTENIAGQEKQGYGEEDGNV